MTEKRLDYRSAGVDVQAGERTVQAIKGMVRSTYNANVLSELGSFGGLFRFPSSSYAEPVLVSSTDGVGTKLQVAIAAGRYDSVGQDLVNHCVNDILVQGAKPLFFLDYIGLGKLVPQAVQEIIAGMVAACRENGCALIGGEMAEMPGIYKDNDFDLVGTIIGVVERAKLLPANRIKAGDLLLGIPSSGLHTNGYSLARKVVFEHLGLSVDSHITELGATVGDELLQVHRSYLKQLEPYLDDARLHGLAHITGGGIPGNLKRIIPDGLKAIVSHGENSYPPLFRWLRDAANLSRDTMLETFNLGVGMIAAIDSSLFQEFKASTGAFMLGQVEKSLPNSPKVVVTD